MVKIGFICEGKTERKIVESEKFQQYLGEIGVECVMPVFDAKGSGNLLPENLREALNSLTNKGAVKVVILTDLDDDFCITLTKKRISVDENRIVVVAVRKVESWFLADSKTLSSLLRTDFFFENPENDLVPFDLLKRIFIERQNRGIGVKDIFTARMLKYGFSIQNAADHPNCPSARYFLNKLQEIANN